MRFTNSRAPLSARFSLFQVQNVAWKAAVLLGWPGTFDAEYVALTQLHADALITLDRHLADAAEDLVTIAPNRSPVLTQAGLTSGTATRTTHLLDM